MAFQVSPGINVSEIDLTTSVPALATTVGGFGGVFRWGPVGKFVLVDSENTLANRFGKPTSDNYETFYTAANFLSYGNALYVSRAGTTTGFVNTATITAASTTTLAADGTALGLTVGDRVQGDSIADDTFVTAANTIAITLSRAATSSSSSLLTFIANNRVLSAYAGNTATVVASNVVVRNSEEFENKGAANATFAGTEFVARYPGALGNSLKVSMCDSATQFSETVVFETNTTWGATTANTYKLADFANATMSIAVGSNTANVAFLWSSADFALRVNTAVSAAATKRTIGSNSVATNIITSAGHGFVGNTTSVYFAPATANSLNTIQGLSAGTEYFVLSLGVDTFSLSLTSNGTPLAISNGAANTIVFVTPTAGLDVGLTLAQARLAVTALRDKITVGDYVEVGNTTIGKQNMKVTAEGPQIDDGQNIYFSLNFDSTWNKSANVSSTSLTRQWEYFNVVDSAPGVSSSMTNAGRTIVDEVSVVVVDEDGLISGTPGQVLEIYQNLSRATDAKKDDGTTNYYKTAINDFSRWIWATNDRAGATSNTILNVANSTNATTYTRSFVRGVDGATESTVSMTALGSAYDLFADASTVDISLLLQGKAIGTNDVQLANYLIDNIAEVRKDCVVFVSPAYSDVVGIATEGVQAQNIVNFRNALRNTSYAFLDSGYKYQYDKYADMYRYVPLNGDIAGLTARSDSLKDPWFSPAGFTRGQIKNLVKLAFSPGKTERDLLYKNDVNPVVTFPGQGTVLYGDKTLLGRASAFDRINVRRLFIVLEKAIATASNSTLFEFNDEFTRSQFVNLVEPYLRDVQGRRGIFDFRVVCDETNNTAEVIDSNRFVGDIYIKPAKSINFIQLNFVAVRSGVEFNEIAGQF
jgi:phage tail sheath protein FI